MNDLGYAIDVKNLSKSFANKKVVDNVSIQVPRGKVYGFLGPNGSGKTTTIRLICGLLSADSGGGTCLGLDIISDSAKIRQRIGYMTQKFSYWEDLTVRENLEFVVALYALDNPLQRVNNALSSFGLASIQHQLAGNLSGGWKQRLALVSCILHEPELLLLDEPTAGVDPKARREFWDEIHNLAAAGLTVLVSTHYMDEVERCHSIIYIASGKVMTSGTVDEVIHGAELTTWIVRGKKLLPLQTELRSYTAINSITTFGDSLHISGTDSAALYRVIEPYINNPDYHWQQGEASMEDVFIYYMSKDNIESRQ